MSFPGVIIVRRAGCTRSAGDGHDKGYLGYTLRCWADTLIELVVVVAVESRFST